MTSSAPELRTDLPLPISVEDITVGWLRQALGPDVAAFEVDDIIWGTATKVLINVSFEDGTKTSLCVKGGFNPELMAQMGPTYQSEARFYGDLATSMEGGVATCHFAGVDHNNGQGIVILDDLRDENTTFGDPRRPLTVDQVAAALEGQASWHARHDNLPDWLPRVPLWRPVIDSLLLTEENWNYQVQGGKAADLPAAIQDRERFVDAIHALWGADDRGPVSVVHCDANVTNVVITKGNQPWFLDWQSVAATHWANDVTLFLVGALEVKDRRAHERDLLATYLQARTALGDRLDADEAFHAYRRHTLQGLMYAFIPDAMQPVEVCAPFIERFAAAICDHEAIDLAATR